MSNWEVEVMADKKSFVAYYSWWDVLGKLDDHQKALVLEAMFSTGGVCEKPELDFVSEIAFIPIEREIQANAEKWEETREKRREAGRKGGKASRKTAKNEEQANEANAYFAKQDQAKVSNAKQSQANQAVDVDVDVDADVDVVNKEKRKKEKVVTASSDCGAECSTAVEPLSQKSKKEANAHFEKLWALYPHKRGKNQVSDKTKRKLLDVSVQEMAEAINRYVQEVRVNDKPWLNGSTWFNGRYLDYTAGNYSPAVASGKKKVRYMSEEGFRDFSGLEE